MLLRPRAQLQPSATVLLQTMPMLAEVHSLASMMCSSRLLLLLLLLLLVALVDLCGEVSFCCCRRWR